MASRIRLAASVLAPVCLAASAGAAVTPLTVTGFNTDVIANAGSSAAASVTAGGLDGQFALYQTGFVDASGNTGGGLPVSATATTLFTSATGSGTQFLIQSASANNTLIVPGGGGTGTLTLATPSKVSALAFIVSGFNGSQPDTYTLNFSNGTTGTGSFTAMDNFNGGSTVALPANGRVQISNDGLAGGAPNPSLYEVDVTAGLNSALTLNSITFTDTNTSGPGPASNAVQTGVFAVSATTIAAVPEPTSAALVAAGVTGLLARRRRQSI